MKKSWKLLPKILSGEKTIESRWYATKRAPWGKIQAGETIYFKDAGDWVSAKAQVKKVVTFTHLTQEKVKRILEAYGSEDGISKDAVPKFFELFKDKKYCLLIFLENPEKIPPFDIDKSGFGLMSAWLTMDNIDQVKVKEAIGV
ncbi:MAG: ASCH domain-containing protein [Patescibacteria group bacterium]